MSIVVAALAYFAYDALRRRLVMTVAFSALPTGAERVASYFINSPEFRDLDRLLDLVEDLRDEVEASDRLDRLQRERVSEIKIDPKVAGFDIEDFRVEQLFQEGFEGLPDRFPAIDAIRGRYRMDGSVRVYQNAEGISVKSTRSTDPKYLLRAFETEMLQPLIDRKYVARRERVEVVSLRRRVLELIFDEGTIGRFTPETHAAIRSMRQRCRAAGIAFRWFVFSEGSAHPGDAFLRQLRRAE